MCESNTGEKNLKQCYVEYLYHKLQFELDLCVLLVLCVLSLDALNV